MLVLAMLAVAFNIVVPHGFMPSLGADRSIVITLCTGQGPAVANISPDGKILLGADPASNHPAPDGDHRSHCAYAGHAALPALPDHVVVPAERLWFAAAQPVAPRRFLRPGTGMPAPPPPSHAPPVLTI